MITIVTTTVYIHVVHTLRSSFILVCMLIIFSSLIIIFTIIRWTLTYLGVNTNMIALHDYCSGCIDGLDRVIASSYLGYLLAW